MRETTPISGCLFADRTAVAHKAEPASSTTSDVIAARGVGFGNSRFAAMNNFPATAREGTQERWGRPMQVIRRRPLARILKQAIEEALANNLEGLSPAVRRAILADAGQSCKRLLDANTRRVRTAQRHNVEAELATARKAAERERDAALRELAELVTQIQGGEVSAQGVALYERRISKLTRSLERLERELSGMSPHALDEGVASIYRTVQGLSQSDAMHVAKREMMNDIFQANLRDFHDAETRRAG